MGTALDVVSFSPEPLELEPERLLLDWLELPLPDWLLIRLDCPELPDWLMLLPDCPIPLMPLPDSLWLFTRR